MRPMGKLQGSLAKKLALIGLALLIAAMTSIGLTLWVSWQLEGGAAAINEAGRLRMATYRIALLARAGEHEALARQIALFDGNLRTLRAGDPSRPLIVPWDPRVRDAFERVRSSWEELRPAWERDPGEVGPPRLLEADEFVDLVDRFVASIETHLSYWTAILHGVQMFMLGLAVVTAVTTAYALHLFLLEPLSRLTAATGKIRRSEFDARVEIDSRDELGTLAAGFNEMAVALQTSYRDLEERVAQKTASLAQQKRRLESLYEIASLVTEASTLEDLSSGFAHRIKRIAGADATAIRWSDESNQRFRLIASESLPPAMVQESRCLHVGQCRCGVSATETALRVIPVRGEHPLQQIHCARAGFATIISVPVRSHQRAVGEIDLFYREPRDPTPDERSLLQALASHLAAAIENLRLAAEARHAAVFEERTMLAQELHDSIAQSLAFLKIQVKLLRDALAAGSAAAVAAVVDEIDAGVRESYGDVRELLIHFRTRTDMEDVEQAIRATLTKFEHQTALKAALTIRGDGMPLAPEVQIQVLHVIQEALSNIRKHSGATRVEVDVEQDPVWRFRVRDHGSGFELGDGAGDETHVGLRIMRERAQRIGAALEVRSTPGSGTEVILTLAESELASASGTAPEGVSVGIRSEQGGRGA